MALLLFFLDAKNPASWAATGANPENWNDVSGNSWPSTTQVWNIPPLVTETYGAYTVKGLRMKAVAGGTYNSLQTPAQNTAVEQRADIAVGDSSTAGNLGYALYNSSGGNFSLSMWIKFNASPIAGGPLTSGQDMPTTVFSCIGASPLYMLCSNLGDQFNPRTTNQLALAFRNVLGAVPGAIAGSWIPSVGVWYSVTMTFQNTSATTGTTKLYINGALNGTGLLTGATYAPFSVGPGVSSIFLNKTYYNLATPNAYDYGGDITFSTFKAYQGVLSDVEIATTFNTESIAYGYSPPPVTGPITWATSGYKLMQRDITNFGRYVGITLEGQATETTFTLAMMEYNYRSQWGT